MNQASQRQSSDSWPWPSSDVMFVCLSAWALPLELLLHHNFGRRYLNWLILPAAAWPIFFAKLADPSADPTWATWAFWIVIGLGVGHKAKAIRLEEQGQQGHSRYSGQPWLGQLLRMNEVSWKCFWEPVLCIAAGLALANANQPLGLFVAAGGIALRMKNWFIDYYERQLIADLRDAYCEQQVVAERFRGPG